jgi:hypothetical protein
MIDNMKKNMWLAGTCAVTFLAMTIMFPSMITDAINVVASGVGAIVRVAVALGTAGILLLICLLPAYIANRRRHHQRTAILALNIFIGLTLIGGSVAFSGFGAIIGGLAALAVIGWTVTGWMAALIWALTAPKRIDADGFVLG